MRLPKEIFRFSSKGYRAEMENLDDEELQLKIYKKRRNITLSKTSATVGFCCLGVTGGTSLIGMIYHFRNLSVEKRKRKILEEFWSDRFDGEVLPERSFQDKWFPMALGIALGCFIWNVDLAILNQDQFAAYAATQGVAGYEAVSHAASAMISGEEKVLGTVGNKIQDFVGKRGVNHESNDSEEIEEKD